MANLMGATDLFGQISDGTSVNREDLIDVITLVDPYETPFFSMVQKGTAQHVLHEWMTETLAATATASSFGPAAEGAAFDGDVITGRTRLNNMCQIFRKDIQVSNTQRAVRPAGIKDEYLHQVQIAIKEIGRQVEFTLLQGTAGSATGNTSTARYMKTLRNFISTNAFSTSSTAIGATGVGFSTTSWALGELMFNSVLERVFLNGGRTDTVFVNGATKRQISRFGASINSGSTAITNRNIDAGSKKLIASVDTYDSDFGVVSIILDRWVGVTEGGSGLGTVNPDNKAFFLQMDTWEWNVLRPLKHVPLPPGGDAVRGMVLTEGTLSAYSEKWNAIVGNIATKLGATSDGTVTS